MQLYGEIYRRALFPLWDSGVKRRADPRAPAPPRAEPVVARPTSWPRFQASRASAPSPPRLRERALLSRSLRRGRRRPLADITTAADLSVAPPADPQPTRRNRGRGEDRSPRRSPWITKRTSGSTGQPLEFEYDAGSEAWRQAVRMRGYGWAGYRQGDRTLHLWSDPPRRAVRRWWRQAHGSRVGRDRSRPAARVSTSTRRSARRSSGARGRGDPPQAPEHDRLLRAGAGRAGAPRGRERRARLGDDSRPLRSRAAACRATGRSSSRRSARPCSRPTGTGR